MQETEPRNLKVGVWKTWAMVICGVFVLILMALVVYGRTLRYEMIFDDYGAITVNDSIKKLTPLFGQPDGYGPLKPLPGTPLEARPLVNFTFALNYFFSQLDPVGYRWTNIAAHVCVACLLWAIVSATLRQPIFTRRFLRNRHWLGFWAAMVWMLHPTHTETVVYLTQRTELQMGLFYALTVYLAIRFWDSPRLITRAVWCALAIAASVCGMLSKEMMASVPAMVFFYEWIFIGGSIWTVVRRSWLLYLGLMLSWYPLVAIYSVGSGTPLAGFNNTISAYDFWLTQSNSFFVYWRLLFFPWPLLLHYHVPTLTTIYQAWPGVLGMALYLVATALCVWRRHVIGFSLLWFFAVLSPTLIVPLPHEEISERRLYVPLFAVVPYLTIVSILGTQSLLRKFTSYQPANVGNGEPQSETATGRALAIAPMLSLSLAYLLISVFTLPRLQHQSDLWLHVLKHQPNNTFAIASQGVEECNMGQCEAGLQKIQNAFDTDPKYRYYNVYLLQTLDDMQEYERLLAIAKKLYELFPDDAARAYVLAAAYEKNGMYADAINKYQEAIQLYPKSWEAHSALATLLAENNKFGEAIVHFEIATELHPDFMNCMNLVTMYINQHQEKKALGIGKLLLEAARKEKSPGEVEQIQLGLQELESQF